MTFDIVGRMASTHNPSMTNSPAATSKSVPAVLQKIAKKINLEPRSVQDVYPCTSLQASLLATSLHGVGSYISTFVFDLSSTPYAPERVRNACETLYNQSPILRTRFLESKGTFLQAVTNISLEWVEHDSLGTYLELNQDKEVKLGHPLARFAWINDRDGKVYMVWSLHHALYDEWSISLLFDDLSTLSSNSVPTGNLETRPKFSRFIKALGQTDQRASQDFWHRFLASVDQYPGLLPDVRDEFETSSHAEYSRSLDVSQSIYQPSTLVIAAWSMFIAKLSASETVVFGNVVNGRTARVPGIVDICGPTMATVPYVVNVPWTGTVHSFLDKLEQTRYEMLQFEQAGLDKYREATGAGRFDTLLSIRSSQAKASRVGSSQELQPTTTMGRRVRHPCLLYIDVMFRAGKLSLNASFDARYLDEDHVTNALEQLSVCLEELTRNLDDELEAFVRSIDVLPIIVPPCRHSSGMTITDSGLAVDPEVLGKVQRAVQGIGPMQNSVSVTPETSLGQLGLDSLSTVILARRLSETFKISVPFRHVTGLRTTVSDISRSLQTILHESNEDRVIKLDLLSLADQHVESFQMSTRVPQTDSNPAAILLTGASGYIGIEILRHLLLSTDRPIILLVRCETSDQGLARIHRTAKVARWGEHETAVLNSRVQIWPSDLGTPELGLNGQQLSEFKQVRTIIHNGARVDFSLDYYDLQTTNVHATAFLLSQHMKSVLEPSFVYLTGGRSCPLDYREPLETTASKLAVANGYAQSKFASEILVHRSRDICLEAQKQARMTIIHPGITIGGESAGVANTDDFVWRYVAASIQMQAYVPAVPTKREWINLMTVESVAVETVSAALDMHNGDDVDHRLMRSGLPVARFWEVLMGVLGTKYVLEPVSEWEWLRRLEEALREKGTKHPLFSLSQLLLQGILKGIGGTGPRPEREPSDEETTVSENAVVANVKYLEDIGFFSREEGDAFDVEVFGRSKR